MTIDEAETKLRELNWCCTPAHPYSTFKMYQAGPRANTESYGPFPEGWVDQVWGTGDTFIEAIEAGLKKLEAHHEHSQRSNAR